MDWLSLQKNSSHTRLCTGSQHNGCVKLHRQLEHFYHKTQKNLPNTPVWAQNLCDKLDTFSTMPICSPKLPEHNQSFKSILIIRLLGYLVPSLHPSLITAIIPYSSQGIRAVWRNHVNWKSPCLHCFAHKPLKDSWKEIYNQNQSKLSAGQHRKHEVIRTGFARGSSVLAFRSHPKKSRFWFSVK